jgi:hypothetical protein
MFIDDDFMESGLSCLNKPSNSSKGGVRLKGGENTLDTTGCSSSII